MGMAESWDASSVTQLLSPSLALASTVSGLMSFLDLKSSVTCLFSCVEGLTQGTVALVIGLQKPWFDYPCPSLYVRIAANISLNTCLTWNK